MTASPLHLAFAAQRDEGPFLVEWVAWQRMLGFEVLVAHNDCTDHSPDLLRALEAEGWLAALEHRPAPGLMPKASAYRAVRGHPLVARAAWMMVLDVDEFPVFHEGDGTVGGYLDAMRARVGDGAGGYAIHWQCFGNGGNALWEDGLVHRQFLRTGNPVRGPNAFFKTLFRDPAAWPRLSDHAPFGRAEPLLDGEGRALARLADASEPLRFTAVEEITHRRAQVNHYVVRADESWALKRGRPSASAGRDRYTDRFHRHRNRNGRRDRSALAYAPRFDAVHAQAMALPGVRRLHHLCCMDYVARLAASQGRAPEGDPRWHHHRALT